MLFTNNCVESLNSTINSLLSKGRTSVNKFQDILHVIHQKYKDKFNISSTHLNILLDIITVKEGQGI